MDQILNKLLYNAHTYAEMMLINKIPFDLVNLAAPNKVSL